MSEEITNEEIALCEANITSVTVSGSVSVNFETFKIEIGGDVPENVGWEKFAKYCENQVNYRRQVYRKKMEAR